MGYTAIEKVMGRVSRDPAHRDGVAADTLLFPDPDMVMIHDGLLREAKQTLDAIGIDRIHAPEKTMVVSDHDVLYGSARAAERGAYNRKAVKSWKIHNFYDAGRGGHGHIFPMEEGVVLALRDIATQAGLDWPAVAESLKRDGRLQLETY